MEKFWLSKSNFFCPDKFGLIGSWLKKADRFSMLQSQRSTVFWLSRGFDSRGLTKQSKHVTLGKWSFNFYCYPQNRPMCHLGKKLTDPGRLFRLCFPDAFVLHLWQVDGAEPVDGPEAHRDRHQNDAAREKLKRKETDFFRHLKGA